LYSDLQQTGNGFGIEGFVTRRLSGRAGITLGLGYGQLPFTVPAPIAGVSNFQTNFIRGDARFDYELSASKVRPYLAAGLSAINFQEPSGTNAAGTAVQLNIQNPGTVDRFSDAAVLVGGGLRFDLGTRLALDVGGNFRYTTGDDFDANKTNKAKDAFFSVLGGLTFFGASSSGTDIYTEQAPVEEVEADGISDFQSRVDQMETASQQQPQDMQEYVKLKSRMDDLNQQIEQKENEINTLRSAVVEKKENVDILENRLAAAPSAGGSSVSFSRAYEEALSKFYAKRYQEAIDQFNSLLAQFPDHSLASNCVYWIGESYFGSGNYQEAITAFNRIASYPRSLKKDDALLMLGRAHFQLNQREEARQAFNRLIQEYPTSEFVGKAQEWLNRM
jgi:tol-pal system protein YbgF